MTLEDVLNFIQKIITNQAFISSILSLAILTTALFISRTLRTILRTYFENSSAYLKVDPTNYKFFLNGVTLMIGIVAFTIIFWTIPGLKGLSLPIFGSAGIIAAIVGFASQQAFANIVSGIFIVIYKPFRVGDYIQIGEDKLGIVDDITLRHTVIRNFENRHIIIPNSKISSETIINSTIIDRKLCIHVEFDISYDTSIDSAIAAIREEAVNHKDCLDTRSLKEKKEGVPVVTVRVISLLDYSVRLRAYVWAKTPETAYILKCDLLKSVKERFDREHIEIPYPYRTIVYKNRKTTERE